MLLVTFITKEFLISNNVYYNSFVEQFSRDQVESMIEQSKKWEWVGYVIVLVSYFIKSILVAICLSLGVFFTIDRFAFKRVLNVAIAAEFIFLVPAVIRLLWFLFVQTNFTLHDLQYFYPLSALNMFEPGQLEPWLIYPLQVLNVFELIYWGVLAFLLSRELPELDINRSMTVVMSSYGTGLVIWIVLIMFLTLTYS